MTENFNKNRILKNTILLYVRMLFTMWLNLWATRLILENLGVEDLGVYGVVGSIVNIFTIFSNGITTAVQRFITFELGRKDGHTNAVFCTSLNVIFILSAILLLMLEVFGVWVLHHKINIPEVSRDAANWVFQLSVLTCIVNLISIPYNALVIAHEKMNVFAAISILQVVLTCGAAYSLSFAAHGKLLLYGILMAVISILIRLIYQVYCRIKLPESHYHFLIDHSHLTQMMRFTGVSTASGVLQMITNQGITFVINWVFGVSINAVYNIALQLKNSILSFAFNLFKAISPQITKTYAEGNLTTHKKLVYSGSKAEVYLIYFVMIPFLFKAEYIMCLWLKDVPDYTVSFARCTIFLSLLYAMFEPIRTAVYATNKISKFMLIPHTFELLLLPTCYFACKITNNPNMVVYALLAFELMTCALRIYYGTKVSILSARELLCEVLQPCWAVAVLSSAFCYGLSLYAPDTLWGLICLLCINSLFLLVFIRTLGISKEEKVFVKTMQQRLCSSVSKWDFYLHHSK